MKADVNLDEHIKDATGATHRLRPRPRHGQVIDDDRERGALHQGEQAGSVRRIDRIGQPDVADAGRRHHFGFADLGAADPGRAPLDLPPARSPVICGFSRVVSANARRVREILDAADISEETVAVDQD